MQANSRFSSGEKKIFVGAALLALCCLAFLMFGSDSFFRGNANNDSPEIGKLVVLKNEARHKSRTDLSWYQAKEEMTLRNGDSLFSGPKSSAQVTLKKGGDVMIGENSLVVFETIDNQLVSNLKSGNFRVKVDGSVKLAINGEVTTINGKSSELQVFYEKNKNPQLRLLAGQADFKKDTGTVVKLQAEKISDFPVERAPKVEVDPVPPAFAPVEEAKTLPVAPTPIPYEAPVLKPLTDEIKYTWKLYDIFKQNGNLLTTRASLPTQVRMNVPLEWTDRQARAAKIQVSENSNMDPRLDYDAAAAPFTLDQVHIGENYWTISLNTQNWSTPQKFLVTADYLQNAEPSVSEPDHQIPLVSDVTHVDVVVTAPIEVVGFVTQASRTPTFSVESSRTFWSSNSNVKLSFYKTGTYYYRFASVSKHQEISNWSNTIKFQVFSPERPPAPILANAKTNGKLGESFPQAWNSKGVRTRVEILNDKGQKLDEIVGDKIVWNPERPGQYKARAFTVNSFGQESEASKIVDIKVDAKQMIAAKPEPIVEKPFKKEPERKVSSTQATSATKISTPDEPYLNDKYKSSQVSLSGFIWTAYSSQQLYQSQPVPVTSGMGLHGMYWVGEHSGFEGSIKKGVTSLNETPMSQISLADLEARYHYRFLTHFPFHLGRGLQISGFGGYEMYRNSGGTILTSQYDLMKFGTALQFPLLNRWSTGGEVVLGRGLDSSSKTEISGNLSYFLKQDFTVGFGYRVFFFEAGTTAASPSGTLPYREGYTEGYSSLNYHF